MPQLASLHVYPVKGLGRLDLQAADVEPWGLAGDRRWMVVNSAGGFISQRQNAALALIHPTQRPGGLRLDAAGHAGIEVREPEAGAALDVLVWRDTVSARPAGPDADRWLSGVLGQACRLVHMADPARARPVDPAFGAPGDVVSFADAFPILVTTDGSLDDLNARLARPVPMNRFRTNIVVSGVAPWAEDSWTRLRIGALTFRVVKECGRCAVPTIDQVTAEKAADNEPIRTLSRFRRRADGSIIFGQNLVPETRGVLRVGDPVSILD